MADFTHRPTLWNVWLKDRPGANTCCNTARASSARIRSVWTSPPARTLDRNAGPAAVLLLQLLQATLLDLSRGEGFALGYRGHRKPEFEVVVHWVWQLKPIAIISHHQLGARRQWLFNCHQLALMPATTDFGQTDMLVATERWK